MLKQSFVLSLLIEASVAFVVSTLPRDAEAAGLAAEEILRQIDSDGANRVLWRLWDRPTEFDQLCDKIESGDPSWLEVARRLKPA